MTRNGITAWQVLGGVAIVLIFMALLAPVFLPARVPSPRRSCASNLKQLGLAVLQYEEDNDECLPDIAAAPGCSNTWRASILPYCKYRGIYQCPSRSDKINGPDGFPRSYAGNYTGNYSGGKSDEGEGAFAGPGSKPVSVAEIDALDKLIVLCEVTNHNTPEFNIDNLAVFDPKNRFLWIGHTGGSNYQFADGHVKWYKPMDTTEFWHRDRHVPLTPAAVAILAAAQSRAGK